MRIAEIKSGRTVRVVVLVAIVVPWVDRLGGADRVELSMEGRMEVEDVVLLLVRVV